MIGPARQNMVIELTKEAHSYPVYPDKRFPPSVYYRFMYLLASVERPQLSVELGLCGGGGSFHLARGYKDGIVVGVDVALEYPDNIAFLQQACSNFEFLRMDSVEAATHIREHHSASIGILFMDTVHEYDHVMREFIAYFPLFERDKSIVLIDDLYRNGMTRAFNELSHYAQYSIRADHLHVGGSPTDGGFGILLM